jgi:hypothetical protein
MLRVVSLKLADVLKVLIASIIGVDLIVEAVSTSETSVSFYEVPQRNISEDCHLLTNKRQQKN